MNNCYRANTYRQICRHGADQRNTNSTADDDEAAQLETYSWRPDSSRDNVLLHKTILLVPEKRSKIEELADEREHKFLVQSVATRAVTIRSAVRCMDDKTVAEIDGLQIEENRG